MTRREQGGLVCRVAVTDRTGRLAALIGTYGKCNVSCSVYRGVWQCLAMLSQQPYHHSTWHCRLVLDHDDTEQSYECVMSHTLSNFISKLNLKSLRICFRKMTVYKEYRCINCRFNICLSTDGQSENTCLGKDLRLECYTLDQ